MRRKPGETGWGKSAYGNKNKTAAHNAHRKKIKMSKGVKTETKKGGTSIGSISGVGVRGWVNG